MGLVAQGVEVLGEDGQVRGETVGGRPHQHIVLQSCTAQGSVVVLSFIQQHYLILDVVFAKFYKHKKID